MTTGLEGFRFPCRTNSEYGWQHSLFFAGFLSFFSTPDDGGKVRAKLLLSLFLIRLSSQGCESLALLGRYSSHTVTDLDKLGAIAETSLKLRVPLS